MPTNRQLSDIMSDLPSIDMDKAELLAKDKTTGHIVKVDGNIGDKFLLMQGEDNGIPGQYAIGYGSKTRWNKKNPPHTEEQTDPVLFTAVGTYEGVTQTYEDIAGIIIDKAQGASASVTYGGKVFEIPSAPEGSGLYQTGFMVLPEVPNAEEEFGLPQLAPRTGMLFFSGSFQVISAEKVEGGWGVIFGVTLDASGQLPPLYPSDPEGGIFTGVIMLDVTAEEGWQEDYPSAYSLGIGTGASGEHSIAMGYESLASGEHSIAMGYRSTASDDHSIALGYRNTASSGYSIALGNQSIASGYFSIAMGLSATASGEHSIATGGFTTASGNYSIAMGHYNVDDATKIFIVGNGSSSRRKNIFTIDYNGKPDSAQIPSVNGGDLVVLGIVPPAAKPAFAGQIYLDANNKKLYVAKAATATTDWVAIN